MLSGFFMLVVWVSSPSETGNSMALTWVLRIVLTAVFLGSLWFAAKPTVSLHLSEKLKEIEPDQNDICPLCNASLMPHNGWRCSGCGVLRTAVRV